MQLLDALDELEGVSTTFSVYRAVLDGRSELDTSRVSGRWNPNDLSVLYAAFEEDGAIAEIHYHISVGQPLFPTKIKHNLFEMEVSVENCIDLSKMDNLVALGVDEGRFKEMLYHRTQEIGAAADFLGYDGIIVPNARWECSNVVLLSGFNFENAETKNEQPIDWQKWITQYKS